MERSQRRHASGRKKHPKTVSLRRRSTKSWCAAGSMTTVTTDQVMGDNLKDENADNMSESGSDDNKDSPEEVKVLKV
jgi:hypothetical protein